MVTTQPWLLISVTTMRRLGGSVNADVVVIDGIMTGDRVVMGNGKLGEVGCCCCCCCVLDWGLDGTAVGGDVDKSSLVSLRLCEWLCGVVEVLQLKGVRRGDVVVVVVGPRWGRCPPVLIMAASQYVTSGRRDGPGIRVSRGEGVSSRLMRFSFSISSLSSATCTNNRRG
jgi:hypothetical protein